MAKQLFYEDVEVGTEITPLVKHPTPAQLVRWACASDDLEGMHYNHQRALSRGLPGIIIHGKLKFAWLGQLMTDWIGEKGILRKVTCEYRAPDIPGDTITCAGEVANKYVKDGEHYVECRIWMENGKGVTSTPGTAIVVLPSRS